VAESPDWLKNHLTAIGLRPINNVVDISNFVLHELGQPLHFFDADKIKGGKIKVQTLPKDTKFVTLDGVERTLSATDLMICNAEEPMCIAGVFGGKESGVTESTKNIFIESAYFNPVNVRKTARYHGLNTDASFRYERGADPNITVVALKRATLLIQEIAGGTVSSEINDFYPTEIKPFDVNLSLKKTNNLIGKEIGEQTIETILKALEINIVNKNNDVYTLQVPPYRVDVQRDVDVIEDILRIYGYNNVEIGDSLKSTLNVSLAPNKHKITQLISEQLTAQGFNEILNNSLTKEAYYANSTSFAAENCVKLLNPLSSDLNVMRQTLFFGGLESIARNINRRCTDLKFYEFGNCYHYNAEKRNAEKVLSPYAEEQHLSLWITGNKHAQSWTENESPTSVYELKAYVENVFARLGFDVKLLKTEKSDSDVFDNALKFYSANKQYLGTFGIVSHKILNTFDIEQDVFYADLLWDNLLAQTAHSKTKVKDLPKYPAVRRDLALLLDQNIQFAEIEKIACETERKLLKKVTLFDVYEGKNLETGKKSYAVSFILQDEEKTLTDSQIDGIMKRLQQNLETKLGARLR
jgi:phenylalanyl-tRNA synthetase beta chain